MDEAPTVHQMMIVICMTVCQKMDTASRILQTVSIMVVAPPAHLTEIPGAPLHRRNQSMDEVPPVPQMRIGTCMTVHQTMDIAIMVIAPPAHLMKNPVAPLHRRNQRMDEAPPVHQIMRRVNQVHLVLQKALTETPRIQP